MPEVRRLGRRRAPSAGGSPIRPPTPPKIKVRLGERGTLDTVRGTASRMDAGVGARRLTSRRTAAIGGVSMAKGRHRMCGAIGYAGSRDTAARLLSGLERLEYRSDSAEIRRELTADGESFASQTYPRSVPPSRRFPPSGSPWCAMTLLVTTAVAIHPSRPRAER